MTQAVNLANFANSLDSSGGLSPTALNTEVPISKGGTNATTAADARTNLGLVIGTDIPSNTGTGATGTWAVNISGNAATATNATNATSATDATNATNATYAVTQTAGTSNTTIATTAFVQTSAANNPAVGVGQTWQNFRSPTVRRDKGVTYTNDTGRPIQIAVSVSTGNGGSNFYINGVVVAVQGGDLNNTNTYQFIIPANNTYRLDQVAGGVAAWWELR